MIDLLVKTAHAEVNTQTANQILDKISTYILNPLIVFVFTLALVYFLIGVVKYIYNADDETERAVGGQHILWGLVGMAIMVSAYGIIRLILNTIGVSYH